MVPDFEYLRVPRESTNDDYVLLVEWLCDDGCQVSEGEPVCSLETSKAVIEWPSPRSGWLFHMRRAGEEVQVGDPVALVSGRPHRPDTSEGTCGTDDGVKVTRKARRLIEEKGLDLSPFAGLEIVREKDVRNFLGRDQPPSSPDRAWKGLSVTPVQRRVAATVERSYRTIPHSYLSRWVDARRCDQNLEELSASEDIMASVSDLLLYVVANTVEHAPKLNAAWKEDVIALFDNVNVGFALNLANGDLVVPVVEHANHMRFDELVARVRGFQKKALRKTFAPRDLTGGTITVTTLIGSGIHQMMPLIVPGQSAIVAVGDIAESSDGSSYCLTLGFDHRVMNGIEAAQFLVRVAALMMGDDA